MKRSEINNAIRWAADLMKVAEITGAKLAFVFPDGQQLFFEPEEPKAEE